MKKTVFTIISFLILILIWYISSFSIKSSLILPFPHEVFARAYKLLKTYDFWLHMKITIFRCFVAFAISLFLSLILGLLCGISPSFDAFFSLPMNIVKVTPVVSFILLAIFWFTSSKVPIFVAVLMCLPVMTNAVSSAIKNSDKKLYDMTIIYNYTKFQKLRWFFIPTILPYFTSGAMTSLGLTWKVVIAGEILSLPKNATGTLLQSAKVHIETVDVYAITIIIVFFSYLCEKIFSLLVKSLKKKFFFMETNIK